MVNYPDDGMPQLLDSSYEGRANVLVFRAANTGCELTDECFEASWWRQRNAVVGTARGRGTVYFVQRAEDQWALRHYWRGGWTARCNRDQYLWTGLESCRPWRELKLLTILHGAGLPVPKPIGARVIRSRFGYSGDLLTEVLPATKPLHTLLRSEGMSAPDWVALGALLRRFHAHDVRHEDLNVGNILRDEHGAFYLLDFDKACLTMPGSWSGRTLRRLHRSLEKCGRRYPMFKFAPADWEALRAGYGAPAAAGEQGADLPLLGEVAADERGQGA